MGLAEAIGTILAVVLIQIARDWRDGKSLFKKNGTYDAQSTVQKIFNSQEQLRSHYNDETTAVLRDILHKIDKILIDGVRIKKE